MRYKPEITKEIINIFLEKSKNQSRTLFNLLSERNAEEFNLLMLAARYQPSTLEYLLFILNQQIHHYEKAEISALFLSQNNQAWNPLSLAVKHQPKAILLIFDFIQVNSDYFDLERLNIIFNQKINTESCFLTILLRYESELAINRCLNFISSRFQDTQNKEWLALILKKEQTGNLLQVATQSTQGAFKALLNFISQHSKQLESETLQQFFLKTNAKDWNCLHHAAYSHPDNLEFILEFIDKHIDQFNVTSLRSLFFAKNQTQSNFLHLVAYHSSITAIDRIFKFLNKHIDFYDETHLQELLLKKLAMAGIV